MQHRDGHIPPKERVLGLSLGGAHKAYPFSVLAKRVDKAGVLEDRVAGQAVRIRCDAKHRTARVEDASGKAMPSVMSFWFAWVAFHPQTEVLR